MLSLLLAFLVTIDLMLNFHPASKILHKDHLIAVKGD